MEDMVIIGIIAVLAAAGIASTVKHFRGQGGCCGGSSYKRRRKRLRRIMFRKTFRVEGMHCEHCKHRVEDAVNDIEGIAGTVSLRKHELTVSYETDVPDEVIAAKIERAGYRVTA